MQNSKSVCALSSVSDGRPCSMQISGAPLLPPSIRPSFRKQIPLCARCVSVPLPWEGKPETELQREKRRKGEGGEMDVVGDLGTFGARDPIVAIRPSFLPSQHHQLPQFLPRLNPGRSERLFSPLFLQQPSGGPDCNYARLLTAIFSTDHMKISRFCRELSRLCNFLDGTHRRWL